MPVHTDTSRLRPARFLAAVTVAVALPALGACQSRGEVTGSVAPSDWRDRHPIVLADAPRVLDVFVEGPSGLVLRERQDIAAFLGEWERHGNGGLIAQVPVGIANAAATRAALASIRGAAGGRMSVQPYHPADPAVASPIRLSFKRLQAKVGTKCGLWPQDLGVSDYVSSSKNEQYWNLGCAAQSNLASQVADPVDLVRARQETPPDTSRRMYNIGQIRRGEDPTTLYKRHDGTVRNSLSN